ncbi:hypothetical protein HY485_02080 [Candidatus Woesearchaeota archaeon]|nr:hypothetical protein [Candidatus Woesearchaeota archaeon]
MKEQTKVLMLLCTVIIIAVGSLIFVFYQYAKIQSDVKKQFAPRVVDQSMLRIENTQIDYEPQQTCQRPNCLYEDNYRIGAETIYTGKKDVNGNNVQGCHKQGTKLTLKSTGKPCTIQAITCIASGWTLASPAEQC